MKIADFFQTRNQDEMKDILERIELLEEEVEVLRDVNKKLRFSLEVLMQARVSPKTSKIVAEKTPVKKIAWISFPDSGLWVQSCLWVHVTFAQQNACWGFSEWTLLIACICFWRISFSWLRYCPKSSKYSQIGLSFIGNNSFPISVIPHFALIMRLNPGFCAWMVQFLKLPLKPGFLFFWNSVRLESPLLELVFGSCLNEIWLIW